MLRSGALAIFMNSVYNYLSYFNVRALFSRHSPNPHFHDKCETSLTHPNTTEITWGRTLRARVVLDTTLSSACHWTDRTQQKPNQSENDSRIYRTDHL